MKKHLLLIFTLLFVVQMHAQDNRPKLVVGIVVDQMKQEYLLRFNNKFSEDGFKRLQKGFVAKNAHYNYIPTSTAPGHASIYTGTSPSYHGIIGNMWYDNKTDKRVYCVEDNTEKAVGGKESSGNVSPRNLLTTTITDELKLSTNMKGKVVGVSIKDRGSALPAGHQPDGAYWYDPATGNFITSTYYTNTLPKWAEDFNNKKLVKEYMKSDWVPSLPLGAYTESRSDNNNYERLFKGKEEPTFPYKLKDLAKESSPEELISGTPFGNTIILDFALAALDGEKLGADNVTDFLAISFSSTDYIGHHFGPHSIEVEDTYIKLDLEIARLLNTLDKRIGEGNYLIFLTADHAAVPNPQFLADQGMPGGFVDIENLRKLIASGLSESYGEGDWVNNMSSYQVFLNHAALNEKNISINDVSAKIKSLLLSTEEVAEVYTAQDLMVPGSKTQNLLANGFNQQRSGDIFYLFKAGYLPGKSGDRGTSHGTGYTYDTHIPILFYGKNIPNKSSIRRINITDIAPTISMLLDISLPASATGEPIIEIFE